MFTGSAAKQDLTRQHPRRLGARLPLLICGSCLSVLANGVARAQASVDYRDYFDRGVQLQAADIPALEAALGADLNNPEIRLKLLGYYSSQNSSMNGPLRQKVIAQADSLRLDAGRETRQSLRDLLVSRKTACPSEQSKPGSRSNHEQQTKTLGFDSSNR